MTGALRFDPVSTNDADSATVQVITQVALDDEPGSLYPADTFAGQPDLKIRVGLNNPAATGVTLDTTSAVEFTDGATTFASTLANPTYVPAGALDFTVTFATAAVAPAMTSGQYPLALHLTGTTDEAIAYAESLSTGGTNEITVAQSRVGLEALVVGNGTVLPGARGEAVLALKLSNGYNSARTLDSLSVSNAATGPGTQGELDGEVESLHLYYDADSSGTFTPADQLIASSSFVSGRAAFVAGGTWSLPAGAVERLLVTADVDSTSARDGDTIDATVNWSSDVVFLEPTVLDDITPLSPLNSFGTITIDGMAARQIALVTAAPDTVYSGEIDQLLATIDLPQNGYAPDVLTGLEVGDASGGFAAGDFSVVRAYRDDGDGVFDSAADIPVGAMAYSGDRYAITGLNIPIVGTLRLFVAADVSTTPGNGDTFRADSGGRRGSRVGQRRAARPGGIRLRRHRTGQRGAGRRDHAAAGFAHAQPG